MQIISTISIYPGKAVQWYVIEKRALRVNAPQSIKHEHNYILNLYNEYRYTSRTITYI